MNKWKCEVDNCGKDADYRAECMNMCDYHWEIYLGFKGRSNENKKKAEKEKMA